MLLIVCSLASILSAVPLGSMLQSPIDLAALAAHDDQVVLTALIEFVWAATGAGIAIGLYPVLRQYNRALALGSVAARLAGEMLVLVGTLSLLALLTLAQESVAAGSAGSSSAQASVSLLLSVREWVPNFLLLPFLLSAAMYYALMYQSRVIPRWLSGWGLVGVAVSLVGTVYAGLTQDLGLATLSTALNIPIGVQEMVLAVWLIAKRFDRSALAAGGEVERQASARRWSEAAPAGIN
jgi:hypothetical protein